MRAERRHHRARLKKNRDGYWAGYAAERAGRAIDTPTPCSCWMCGNPRHYLGEKSLQERSTDELFRQLGC